MPSKIRDRNTERIESAIRSQVMLCKGIHRRDTKKTFFFIRVTSPIESQYEHALINESSRLKHTYGILRETHNNTGLDRGIQPTEREKEETQRKDPDFRKEGLSRDSLVTHKENGDFT